METGKKDSKSKEKAAKDQGMLFELGNEADDKLAAARGRDQQYLKLDNMNGPNIFGLMSPRYVLAVEHWFEIKGKKEKVTCAVHATNDREKIMHGRDPDSCKWCECVSNLFEQAKEDKDDPINKKKKEIAKEIMSTATFLFIAIKGDADITRQGNQKVVKPYFENTEQHGLLQLTEAAFNMFRDQFEADALKSSDLVGMPVNFRKGKKTEKSTYSQVLEVQFFPKLKFPVKDINPDKEFAGIGVYDQEHAEQRFEEWKQQLDELLGEVKSAKRSRR